MFANTPYFPAYSQAQQQPNTSGMNAPQTQVPDHTQLSLPTPTPIPANYNGTQIQDFQRPKRKQVKNACVNCQKACKKCDEQRPCPRCIKYGLVDTCVDSVRKERKKGIKRGPYKKRKQANGVNGDGTTTTTTNIQVPTIPNGLYHAGNPTTTADGRTTQAPTTTNLSYANYSSDQFGSFPAFQGQSLQYLQQYGAMNLILQQAGAASIANAVNNTNTNTSNNNNGDKSNEGQNGTDQKSTEDEDGNKLSILSQLCTAVLDHVPATTNNNNNNNNDTATPNTDNTITESKELKQETSSTSTPSQSNNHSREPSKTEPEESKPIIDTTKESNDK
ncbi:unnamed protein product [Cunninghamella blakesleeana]